MADSRSFLELKNQYEERMDFVIIYIEEAHPTGEWVFKDQEQITQHKSIEDRITQASKLQKTYPTISIYVDQMSNKLNNAFGAFPERLYVLLDDVVVYQGGSTPINYSLKDLEKWIAKYVSKMERPEKSMLPL